MAGFAVFMTFLTWGFVLLIVATVLSFVLGRIAKSAAPETDAARSYRLFSRLAPFIGLVWLVIAIKIHVLVSNDVAHQSVGYSPDPYVTLPNGFTLGSLNTYDGYLVAPGHTTDVPVTGPGYVRSIITVDWQGDIFRGTLFDFKSSSTENFTFNSRTLEIKTSPAGNTTWQAANDKAQAGPQSYWVIYKQHRHTWPGYVFFAILLFGELLVAYAVLRFRKRALAPGLRFAES